MIKKYQQYIKEYYTKNITIKFEELEDEFLRLKEVFGCKIFFRYGEITISIPDEKIQDTFYDTDFREVSVAGHNFNLCIFRIRVYTEYDKEDLKLNISKKFTDEEKQEINSIKRRIENKYDVIMKVSPGLYYPLSSIEIIFVENL